MKNDAQAWSDFWAHNARGSVGGGTAGGCLPQRWAAIEKAQSAAWIQFAQDLPEAAKVLDLATGDARVLAWMQSSRSDLALNGIDLAPQIPPPPNSGITTQGSIAMEDLPFDDDSMHAVVSQFGFEYGDVVKVAAEIARVLAEGGKVGLMVHRGDGPILEHNKQRRAELLWALKEKGTARKARNMLKAGPSGIEKAAKLAAKVASQGAAKFGQQSPAWEIPEAIRRSCLMGQRAGVGSIVETIALVERQAVNEIGRIQSLANACTTADKRDVIVKAFAGHGLDLRQTQAICEPSGRALADFITFS